MVHIPGPVSSFARDVSSSAGSLAHDISSRAQDAAQSAGDLGREWVDQAVDAGRHNLQSIRILPRRRSSRILPAALISVGCVVALVVAWRRWQAHRSSANDGRSVG